MQMKSFLMQFYSKGRVFICLPSITHGMKFKVGLMKVRWAIVHILFFFLAICAWLLCGVMSGPWDPMGVSRACHASFLHALYLCLTRGLLDVLFRDSKLTMLLSESLGNINCQTTMIAHVSDSPTNYMETLTTVQLASRIYRTRKKKTKVLDLFFKFIFMQSI